MVVYKLIANRHRDRADVFEILRSGTQLDRAYIERLAAEWDVSARWQEALAETSQ